MLGKGEFGKYVVKEKLSVFSRWLPDSCGKRAPLMQLNTLLCGRFHMLPFTNTYSLPRHGYELLILVKQSDIPYKDK